MARRKRFGMYHKPHAAHRAFRAGLAKPKKISVTVTVGRNPTMGGSAYFTAIACAKSRSRSVKGSHCSGLRGGTTPTKAAAAALEELGKTLARAR